MKFKQCIIFFPTQSTRQKFLLNLQTKKHAAWYPEWHCFKRLICINFNRKRRPKHKLIGPNSVEPFRSQSDAEISRANTHMSTPTKHTDTYTHMHTLMKFQNNNYLYNISKRNIHTIRVTNLGFVRIFITDEKGVYLNSASSPALKTKREMYVPPPPRVDF